MTGRPTRRGVRAPSEVMRLGIMRLGVGQRARRALDPALPWPVQRTRLDQITHSALLPRGTMIAEQAFGGVRAEVISSRGKWRRTVVHFHGGGYCVGSALTVRSWAAQLSAQAGCRVVLPEYRLAPEHPHPAALEDARAVMAALSADTQLSGDTGLSGDAGRSSATGLSGDAGLGSMVVSGDSAGGGLALALLLSMREEGRELPAGCILLSPWLDLGRDRRAVPELVRQDLVLSPEWLEACARAYADPAAWADHLVSPLHAEHFGLPPLLIQAATAELLAPDAELLAASAAAAGVDVTYTKWRWLWHNFMLQAGLLAAADDAVAEAAWFVDKVTPDS